MNIVSPFHCHIAFPGFEADLCAELKNLGAQIFEQKDRLVVASQVSEAVLWSQCTWQDPQWLAIDSINDAVVQLKKQSHLWMGYSFQLHRRTELIQDRLLRMQPKPLTFLKSPAKKNFGAWCLWDEKLILASAKTSSALPLGLATFNEDKSIPSRAYLKLWELFTIHEAPPAAKARVLDLGSSPGGWTWVLSELGLDVLSVDKAPLDERLLQRKNVQVIKKDAFTLSPQEVGAIDVLFSDIICEPKRLLELVRLWIDSGLCRKLICSIKFKGPTDFDIIGQFKAIPGSRLYHLCANKHELTWVCDVTPPLPPVL
jgi:23S rRNA (cytidine2498-2'-O)-methyltransferase